MNEVHRHRTEKPWGSETIRADRDPQREERVKEWRISMSEHRGVQLMTTTAPTNTTGQISH